MIRILILSFMASFANAGISQDAVVTTAFLQWTHMHCPGVISREAYQKYKKATVAVSNLTEAEFERRMTAELDSMAHYYVDSADICAFTKRKLSGVSYGGIQ